MSNGLRRGIVTLNFFHRKASARRSTNRIMNLTRADGSVCDNQDELEAMATEFYANLYSSEGTIQ